jgi:hypothetical protein
LNKNVLTEYQKMVFESAINEYKKKQIDDGNYVLLRDSVAIKSLPQRHNVPTHNTKMAYYRAWQGIAKKKAYITDKADLIRYGKMYDIPNLDKEFETSGIKCNFIDCLQVFDAKNDEHIYKITFDRFILEKWLKNESAI